MSNNGTVIRPTDKNEGESREPGGNVGHGPEEEDELDGLEDVLDEHELLGLVEKVGSMINEDVNLGVGLVLGDVQVLVQVFPGK